MKILYIPAGQYVPKYMADISKMLNASLDFPYNLVTAKFYSSTEIIENSSKEELEKLIATLIRLYCGKSILLTREEFEIIDE